MSWAIASIPFWLLGAVCSIGAICWAIDGLRAEEPIAAAAINSAFGLAMAGGCFAIAAKLAS